MICREWMNEQFNPQVWNGRRRRASDSELIEIRLSIDAVLNNPQKKISMSIPCSFPHCLSRRLALPATSSTRFFSHYASGRLIHVSFTGRSRAAQKRTSSASITSRGAWVVVLTQGLPTIFTIQGSPKFTPAKEVSKSPSHYYSKHEALSDSGVSSKSQQQAHSIVKEILSQKTVLNLDITVCAWYFVKCSILTSPKSGRNVQSGTPYASPFILPRTHYSLRRTAQALETNRNSYPSKTSSLSDVLSS